MKQKVTTFKEYFQQVSKFVGAISSGVAVVFPPREVLAAARCRHLKGPGVDAMRQGDYEEKSESCSRVARLRDSQTRTLKQGELLLLLLLLPPPRVLSYVVHHSSLN
ncbi:hypothetical protein KM043_016842 [Ampulex compressa]|nr:hypothetical protein KM043_016842 [Ampulex compressa]